MSVENFEQVLRARQSTAGQKPAGHPDAELQAAAPLPVAGLPQDAIDAIKRYQADWRAFNAQLCTQLTDDVDRYLADRDVSAFQNRMKDRAEQVTKTYNVRLDNLFDALVASGRAHPEAQEAILNAAKSISQFTDTVIRFQLDFIADLSANIIKWSKSAKDKINSMCSEVEENIAAFFEEFQ